MKVFKYHPPYKANGRTSFPETQKRSGVYLIKENDKLVYVGFSGSDLYRTLYRHFQVWTDKNYRGGKAAPPEHRVTYVSKMKRNRYTVRVTLCTPAQAERLERMLIRKHNPRDNRAKYESYEVKARDQELMVVYALAPVEQSCPF